MVDSQAVYPFDELDQHMRTSRLERLRLPLPLIAAMATLALAAAPAASAQESPPSVGSAQVCAGTQGGALLQITGFGSSFPANTTGTTTFTFANGDVVSLTATTDADGNFRTETFVLDLSDPELAALAGTRVQQTASFGAAEGSLTFVLITCSAAPDDPAECKDGGSEDFPALGFRNQGDCVSFVATGGRNEPRQNVP
jgi:hypothetical protein